MFEIGERVVDEYLGPGVVTAVHHDLSDSLWAYTVYFDKRPEMRYNMAENPTIVFHNSLEAEEVK